MGKGSNATVKGCVTGRGSFHYALKLECVWKSKTKISGSRMCVQSQKVMNVCEILGSTICGGGRQRTVWRQCGGWFTKSLCEVLVFGLVH